MVDLRKIRQLDIEPGGGPDPRTFLGAASGLVRRNETLYVIADDELTLAIFDERTAAPGRLERLMPGRLPADSRARKAAKPDFEVLMRLPAGPGAADGALLALGSGSGERRREAILIPFAGSGVGVARVVDFSSIYSLLDGVFDDVNIEGGAVVGDAVRFFQRGNVSRPGNAIATLPLRDVMGCIAGAAPAAQAPAVAHLDLGTLNGIPLGVTDACVLTDGDVVVTAVAENTPNAYDDGPCAGAAVALLRSGGVNPEIHPLPRPIKVEGVDASEEGEGIRLLMVTDADDPDVAAELYEAVIPR